MCDLNYIDTFFTSVCHKLKLIHIHQISLYHI